jgi:hypothetical protein
MRHRYDDDEDSDPTFNKNTYMIDEFLRSTHNLTPRVYFEGERAQKVEHYSVSTEEYGRYPHTVSYILDENQREVHIFGPDAYRDVTKRPLKDITDKVVLLLGKDRKTVERIVQEEHLHVDLR